jgi:RNase H-like domain found in reverse transcriptase
MDCLGHRIDNQGLHADSSKMARILEWRTPQSYPKVLRFIGLVKYLAHFMPDVLAYTSPMESICSNGQPFYWRPLHETCLSCIKDLARKTPILRTIDVRVNEPIWVVSDASGYGVGALYGQGPNWRNCRPAGFMSKKFTSAQRSYRTFEHEALAVIEALMKWEDKLVGRQFTIVTDHKALETIKTTNHDGKSGRLICWDKYLSRFKYEVMHIPGEQNKVADCLSRYYENDRYDEVHEPYQYVSADVCLDPNGEDLTELRLQELGEDQLKGLLFAQRLRDRNEDRVVEAETMAKAARLVDIPEDINPQDDIHDMTVGEALQNGPSLRKIVLEDKTFLQAVKDGYEGDSTLSKVIANPGHYPLFRVVDGVIHMKNRLGDECMCIP